MLYRFLYALLLSRIDAERVHRLTARALRAVVAVPPLRRLLHALLAPRDPALRTRALGLDVPSPLGLAAGFDKDAGGCDADLLSHALLATLGAGVHVALDARGFDLERRKAGWDRLIEGL